VVRAGRTLVWEPVQPDLTWHIRAVPAVQGRAGFEALAATMMTTPLPADRPLWELLVVPGAGVGAPGIVLRVHHCIADGVAGVRVLQQLFGDGDVTEAPSAGPAAPSEPGKAGSTQAVARRRVPRFRALATSVTRIAAVFRSTVPATALLGPIGPNRGVTLVDADLGALATAVRPVSATVNDALLVAVAAGATAALRGRGHPVPAVLPASVPVALSGRGSSGNAVGVMVVPLVTETGDARALLEEVASVTRTAKEQARAQGTFELTRSRWGSRLFARLARRQRFIALFVTNVRGPECRLRVGGAPLIRAWPVAPIQGNVRFGVAAMSYAGRFEVAVHVDADAVDVVAAGRALADELARLGDTT